MATSELLQLIDTPDSWIGSLDHTFFPLQVSQVLKRRIWPFLDTYMMKWKDCTPRPEPGDPSMMKYQW